MDSTPQLRTLASAPDTEASTLDSAELSRICEQSLMRRSKHSPAKTYLREWKLGNLMRLRSGVISSPSLGKSFLDWWTSSLADTHASHLVQPGNAEARTTQGTSGPISQTEFDFLDQGAASLRTSKDISRWGCPTSSKTWQEWVTERRGEYSARLNAERLTRGSESSSWPTPTANEDKDQNASFATLARLDKGGRILRRIATLTMRGNGPAAPASSSTDGSRPELWHTPTQHQKPQTPTAGEQSERETAEGAATQSVSSSAMADSHRIDRSTQAEGREHDRQAGSAGEELGDTDNSRRVDWDKENSQFKSLVGDVEKITPLTHGKLNTRWVETLMGLPVGWTMPSCASPVTIERTSSDCSETVLSQQPPLSPSEPCSEK